MDIYDIARPAATNNQPQWSVESLIRAEPWTQDASCAQVDPDLHFPDKSEHRKATNAKKVCAGCPVAAQCLEYALRNNEKFGIWGGLTTHERTKLQQPRPHRNADKEECVNGHRFTPENTQHSTYVGRDGSRKPRRVCKTCANNRSRKSARA